MSSLGSSRTAQQATRAKHGFHLAQSVLPTPSRNCSCQGMIAASQRNTLRGQILEPRRSPSLSAYALAAAEWEKDQEKLVACGGDLPGTQELLIAYVRLVPEQVKKYAQERLGERVVGLH